MQKSKDSQSNLSVRSKQNILSPRSFLRTATGDRKKDEGKSPYVELKKAADLLGSMDFRSIPRETLSDKAKSISGSVKRLDCEETSIVSNTKIKSKEVFSTKSR